MLDQTEQDRLRTDLLLAAAYATRDDPRFRDRVRLTHRGVAAKAAKFDRGLLQAGHRFSGELRLWSGSKEAPEWQTLLGLLNDPRLRLGGATRAGMGDMRLVGLHAENFDLRKKGDSAAFCHLGPGLAEQTGLQQIKINELPKSPHVQTLSIKLTPRDFWRIGQGNHPLGSYDKAPDLLPKLEPVVRWENGRAAVDTRLALVPGSSVKGALAHRTAFHWNAMTGSYVDDMAQQEITDWDKSKHCEGVRQLFGYAKDRRIGQGVGCEDTGRAGHLFIDDIHVQIPVDQVQAHLQAMIHNSLDRFTGGVRNRMLFTEELIYKRPIKLTITLLPGVETADTQARSAFARALRDLCDGHLALGAGATKGHGSFTGAPADKATRDWLEEQGEEWS